MTVTDEYNKEEKAMQLRFPTIVLRPSTVYLVYKEMFYILLCVGALFVASYPAIPFRIFFIWLAIITTFVMLYQMLYIRSAQYTITHDRIKIIYGVWGSTGEKIEMYRVKDVSWQKPFILRAFGYGNVTIHSTDYTRPTLVIPGVREPEKLMTVISDRVEVNRLSKRVYEIANR